MKKNQKINEEMDKISGEITKVFVDNKASANAIIAICILAVRITLERLPKKHAEAWHKHIDTMLYGDQDDLNNWAEELEKRQR